MQIGDKIRSLFNGGAEAAGVDGLKSAIAGLEKDAADARAELATIPAQRQALLLADNERKLDDLDKRETALYRTLEKVEAAVQKIRQRLTELQVVAKKTAIARHRSNIEAHADALEKAVTVAIEANEAAKTARNLAFSELGPPVANMVIPDIHYPGFLTELAFKTWRDWVRNMLAKSPTEWPRPMPAPAVSRPATPVEAPTKVPDLEIKILDPGFQNGPPGPAGDYWRPGSIKTVPAPWAKRLVESGRADYTTSGQSEQRVVEKNAKPRRRAAMRDDLRPGERLVTFLREGYQTPDGKQRVPGDVVSLPAEIALSIVKSGTADFTEQAESRQ